MCFRCFIPKLDDPNCHLTDEEIKNLTIPYDTASEVRLVGCGHFSALQKKTLKSCTYFASAAL